MSNLDLLVSKMFYAYTVHRLVTDMIKQEGKKSLKYGYVFRYGRYALVYVSSILMANTFREDIASRSLHEIEQYIKGNISSILEKWKEFELQIQSHEGNKGYFNPSENLADFDGYYKGNTLAGDLEKYFKNFAK
jgi:hypothetical protein